MKMLGRTGLSRRETWKTRERHNRKGKGVASRSFSRKSSFSLSLSLYYSTTAGWRVAKQGCHLDKKFFLKILSILRLYDLNLFPFLFYFIDHKILDVKIIENNSLPNFFEILNNYRLE